MRELGYDPHWLPSDHNPITRALREPDFVGRYGEMKGFNRTSLSQVATICQMAVFDAERGPEGDDKPKALRRHWYAWYKSEFAQPLSEQLGEDLQGERWGTNWAGRLSQTYAGFVDNGHGITYRDLWVEDASRMMERNWETLFRGCHIIVAVEKDSLFSDFIGAAKALGARTVYSGKGKSSKAAIEKVLREHFNWHDDGCSPFSEDEPLIILHISDHDFDGEAVIGPTFGEQASRYCGHILEARVGIKPETVTDLGHDPTEKWYQVKVSNAGYVRWAEEKALFLAECRECGHRWPVVGSKYHGPGCFLEDRHCCPKCGEPACWIEVGKDGAPAHGYEVEALKTRDYYGLLVDALLQVLPFDYIVGKLRDECHADAQQAADELTREICEANEDYRKILARFEELQALKDGFEELARRRLADIGAPHVHDWRDDDDDPTPEHYRGHVERATDWSSPWRPFSRRDRTDSLVEWLRDNAADDIEELENWEIL